MFLKDAENRYDSISNINRNASWYVSKNSNGTWSQSSEFEKEFDSVEHWFGNANEVGWFERGESTTYEEICFCIERDVYIYEKVQRLVLNEEFPLIEASVSDESESSLKSIKEFLPTTMREEFDSLTGNLVIEYFKNQIVTFFKTISPDNFYFGFKDGYWSFFEKPKFKYSIEELEQMQELLESYREDIEIILKREESKKVDTLINEENFEKLKDLFYQASEVVDELSEDDVSFSNGVSTIPWDIKYESNVNYLLAQFEKVHEEINLAIRLQKEFEGYSQ